MAEELSRTTRDPQAEHLCPACGRPRQVLARRHKVLGAWVPEWEVQPCRDPACELYEVPDDGAPETPPEAVSEVGAEATTAHVTGKNGETGRSPAAG